MRPSASSFVPFPRAVAATRLSRKTPTSTTCIARLSNAARAAIDGPDGLPNARDLASASSKIRPGKIFRGATPACLPPRPHPDALHFLRNTDTLIDLRSRDERMADHVAAVRAFCGPRFEERERHVGLLNKRKVVWGLARVLPREQVRELAVRVVTNPLMARQGIVDRMDRGGLMLLNRIMVEAGATQIARAMRLVTEGAHSGRVYFYCSAGKDRTGLLAALILKVLGVCDNDIVCDYVRSSDTWENGPYQLRADYCAKLEDAGLTPVNWLGAPAEVMEGTLDYIDRQYGSVEDYLIYSGYDEDHMKRLREAVAPR